MYRFHQEKRIKPGLAITQRHIRLCDGHLRAAGVSSRNEFVEKAIECYAGWLDVKQNPEFFRELFGPDIGRMEERCAKQGRSMFRKGSPGARCFSM